MTLKAAVCLFVRDEEREISEWIAYHSLVGVDTFIIYNNDSRDMTHSVLDRMRRLFDIIIIDWPRHTKYSQLEAYDDCLLNFSALFDWIAFIDSDEFIAPIRDGNIKVLLKSLQSADCLVLNWALFGSSGHIGIPDGLVTEMFTKRAESQHDVNSHTKMIVKPSKAIRVAGPHEIKVEGLSVHADGSGFSSKQNGTSKAINGFDICHVNHYFVKSRAHWAAKMKRGYREGHRASEQFTAHDLNDVEDQWALKFTKRIKGILAVFADLPIRPAARRLGPVAMSEEEKQTEAWKALPSEVKELMYVPPKVSAANPEEIFDEKFYLNQNPDVAQSGIQAFEHYRHCGFREGRWPCGRQRFKEYIRQKIEQKYITMEEEGI